MCAQIAKAIGISRATVQIIIKNYNNTNTPQKVSIDQADQTNLQTVNNEILPELWQINPKLVLWISLKVWKNINKLVSIQDETGFELF